MTVGAITFDAGFSPSAQFTAGENVVFALPDDSGLAPLVLPEEFLRREDRQVEPSSDAVRRFEAAMSPGSRISPFIAKGLVAYGISEAPLAENAPAAPVDSRRGAEAQSFARIVEPIVEPIVVPSDARQETREFREDCRANR